MNSHPHISVCIPAFQHPEYLKRLLHSIALQTFKNYEVIVTDDSADDAVKDVCRVFDKDIPIWYYKNPIPLGTPANWNYAISLANGKWIKIMHHDDWFSQAYSLQKFYEASLLNIPFIFSGYTDIENLNNAQTVKLLSRAEERLLRKSPSNLFKLNLIGPPSTTLIKNDLAEWYDPAIKWVVDFEFYMRYLRKHPSFFFIKDALINVGLHDGQVTKSVFRKREVEIPENIYLLNKIGVGCLKNIFVYDYYWRLLRNVSIRKSADLTEYVDEKNIPKAFMNMLRFQSLFPLRLLKVGIFSKAMMLLSYVTAFLFLKSETSVR